MERSEWLKQMRKMSESLYDQLSPEYWVSYGFYENQTHLKYLKRFLEKVAPCETILSAGCGAGRYDGLLMEAGHPVLGIDQSAGMLARAKDHFPQGRYEKIGLQEISFQETFDGIICMDSMEHVSPEDYLVILQNFQRALKPGGVLYFTMDESASQADLEQAYQHAKAKGLPVVFGELVDEVDTNYEQIMDMDQAIPSSISDSAVYHFYPALEQARKWIGQAGLVIEEEGMGSGYHHFIARKAITSA